MGATSVTFSPLARVGENVLVLPLGKYFRVEAIGEVPWLRKNYGSIPAASATSPGILTVTLNDVKVDKGQLFQFRWRFYSPDINLEVRVYKPRAMALWRTKSVFARMTAKLPDVCPDLSLSEIHQFEDEEIVADFFNWDTAAEHDADVVFFGHVLYLRELKEKPARYAVACTRAEEVMV